MPLFAPVISAIFFESNIAVTPSFSCLTDEVSRHFLWSCLTDAVRRRAASLAGPISRFAASLAERARTDAVVLSHLVLNRKHQTYRSEAMPVEERKSEPSIACFPAIAPRSVARYDDSVNIIT